MTGYIKDQYRGMTIIASPLDQRNYPNDKIECVLQINAYIGDRLMGGWEFVNMRIDPNNPNPNERFYLGNIGQIKQSGRDLVDRILNYS